MENQTNTPPYEEALPALRQVWHEHKKTGEVAGIPYQTVAWGYYKVQQKWQVQDGPLQSAMSAPPEFYERPWIHHPKVPMTMIPVRYEWRDIEAIDESQMLAERAAALSQPQISTTT